LGVPLFQEQLLRMAMVVADFTGGEAKNYAGRWIQEVRSRMKDIEIKLRRGMETKGIIGEVQETRSYSRSHHSRCRISGITRGELRAARVCKRLFQVSLPRSIHGGDAEQPADGFYNPATLVKDAQRHGLKFKPIDVTRSEWQCTLEQTAQGFVVRIGMRYVRGLRKETAEQIMRERRLRKFTSIDELKRRHP